MSDEKKIMAYRGYVYESDSKKLNDKELHYVYDELSGSLKHLNNVLNMVRDGNAKRSIQKSMKHIRDSFNKNIKDPTELYGPKTVDDMAERANEVDKKMKAQQGVSDSASRSEDPTIEDSSSLNP